MGWSQTAEVKQQSAPKFATLVDVIREHEWGDAVSNLLDIVEAMPDADYSYRPAPGMRSFGEIVGHIANVQFAFCDIVTGAPAKPARDDWEKRPGKAESIRGLRQSIQFCDGVLDGMTGERLSTPTARGGLIGDALITMNGHTRRETGKLVTYLTAKGHKAPAIVYQQGRRWRTAPK